MSAEQGAERTLLTDDFPQDRTEGKVIGSLSTSGHKRLGKDVEGVLSIDNGALRIAPLIEAGFGRAVLAYGPFPRQAGLALAVHMTNGHNTSQAEPLSDTFRHRVNLWMRGSETDPPWMRLISWLLQGRFRRAYRKLKWWRRTSRNGQATLLNENLAVGWFSMPAAPDPRTEGSAFIVHALGPENGELWAGRPTERTRPLRGVQNVPIYYVAIIRGEGVLYCVSSIEGTDNMPPYPWLRPVAIDRGALPDTVYAAVQQSVLGQVGFRSDSRIHGVRIARLPGYESWWGGAHAADRLTADGMQRGAAAEKGGKWQVFLPRSSPCVPGDTKTSIERLAVLDPGAPSGLIHSTTMLPIDSPTRVVLLWRFIDEANHWRLELSGRAIEMVLVLGGNRTTLLSRGHSHSAVAARQLQVLDDGTRLMAYVDGEPLSNKYVTDSRLHDATKVGIHLHAPTEDVGTIGVFEAHPRQLRLPVALDMGARWVRKGSRVIIEDDFSGEAGDLDDRTTKVGNARWQRIIGKGIIEATGRQSARVRASREEPSPGRTAYCIDWCHSDFADMQVTITPPGIRRGDRQRTTAGFILYQDAANYVTLNAYRADYYPGGSISTFFRFGGFEDVYDAVWSNVGDRVDYGKPLRLRLCCDGERYVAYINDETILMRAFRDIYADVGPLVMRKLGIIANWEFGTDTGSTFEHLQIRY